MDSPLRGLAYPCLACPLHRKARPDEGAKVLSQAKLECRQINQETSGARADDKGGTGKPRKTKPGCRGNANLPEHPEISRQDAKPHSVFHQFILKPIAGISKRDQEVGRVEEKTRTRKIKSDSRKQVRTRGSPKQQRQGAVIQAVEHDNCSQCAGEDRAHDPVGLKDAANKRAEAVVRLFVYCIDDSENQHDVDDRDGAQAEQLRRPPARKALNLIRPRDAPAQNKEVGAEVEDREPNDVGDKPLDELR